MYAVITDVLISDTEAAQRELRENVVPMVKQIPGFVSGVWMENGEGKGHSIVVFENEGAAKAVAEQLPSRLPAAVTLDGISVREVVASA
jgi:hypothetical protein